MTDTAIPSERENPYIAGAPITDPAMFFGRQDVFTWIRENIHGHPLVIHGQRRVGKTSVLRQLQHGLPARYLPVYYDLQGRTTSSLELFLYGLAREIARRVKSQLGMTLPVPERERFEADPDVFEREFLSQVQRELRGHVLIICLDEFDLVEDNPIRDRRGRSLSDLISQLLNPRSSLSGLSFIFSIGSSGRKLENMKAAFTAIFKTALYKKITFLTREDSFRLITTPVEDILEYEPAALQLIYRLTSGHPYYIQLICHELFSRFAKQAGAVIRAEDVEAVLPDTVERGTVNLKFAWDEADPAEKWVLAALAHLPNDLHSDANLGSFLAGHGVALSSEEQTKALIHLREKEVLNQENLFTIYPFKLWLKENWPVEKVREVVGDFQGEIPVEKGSAIPLPLEVTPLPIPSRRLPGKWMIIVGLTGLLNSYWFGPGKFLGGIPVPPTLSPTATITFTPTSTIPISTPTLRVVLTTTVPSLTLTMQSSPTMLSPTMIPTSTQISAGIQGCTNIGQTYTRPKDNANMVCVPAGDFPMGYPNCKEEWCQVEANQGMIKVPAFWIDRNEVTNAQFQLFVKETGFITGVERMGFSEVWGINKPVAGAYWRFPQGPSSSITDKLDHPVVQINWFSANAYCQWVDGRLPSEAQWEKAARGADGRLFPWGNEVPNLSYLNAADPTNSDGFTFTAPVGRFPAGDSPYGVQDMAGNVYEWTRSLFRGYPYIANDGREIQDMPGENDEIVVRGGSFYTDYGSVRSTWRYVVPAQRANDGLGFRCVIDSFPALDIPARTVVPTSTLKIANTPTKSAIKCQPDVLEGRWYGELWDINGIFQKWTFDFTQTGCNVEAKISAPYITFGIGNLYDSTFFLQINYKGDNNQFNPRYFVFTINDGEVRGFDVNEPTTKLTIHH